MILWPNSSCRFTTIHNTPWLLICSVTSAILFLKQQNHANMLFFSDAAGVLLATSAFTALVSLRSHSIPGQPLSVSVCLLLSSNNIISSAYSSSSTSTAMFFHKLDNSRLRIELTSQPGVPAESTSIIPRCSSIRSSCIPFPSVFPALLTSHSQNAACSHLPFPFVHILVPSLAPRPLPPMTLPHSLLSFPSQTLHLQLRPASVGLMCLPDVVVVSPFALIAVASSQRFDPRSPPVVVAVAPPHVFSLFFFRPIVTVSLIFSCSLLPSPRLVRYHLFTLQGVFLIFAIVVVPPYHIFALPVMLLFLMLPLRRLVRLLLLLFSFWSSLLHHYVTPSHFLTRVAFLMFLILASFLSFHLSPLRSWLVILLSSTKFTVSQYLTVRVNGPVPPSPTSAAPPSHLPSLLPPLSSTLHPVLRFSVSIIMGLQNFAVLMDFLLVLVYSLRSCPDHASTLTKYFLKHCNFHLVNFCQNRPLTKALVSHVDFPGRRQTKLVTQLPTPDQHLFTTATRCRHMVGPMCLFAYDDVNVAKDGATRMIVCFAECSCLDRLRCTHPIR